MVGHKNLPQGLVVGHQRRPQYSGRVFPSRVRLAAVNALKGRSLCPLVPHEIAVRSDETLDVFLGET